jgi:hypothetical protein
MPSRILQNYTIVAMWYNGWRCHSVPTTTWYEVCEQCYVAPPTAVPHDDRVISFSKKRNFLYEFGWR